MPDMNLYTIQEAARRREENKRANKAYTIALVKTLAIASVGIIVGAVILNAQNNASK